MFLVLAAVCPVVFAQTPIDSSEDSAFVLQERVGGRLGLGAAIGAPSGLAGKLWFGDWSALQMSLGGDLGEHRSLALTADYVVAYHPIESPDDSFELPLYIGAGAKVDGDFQDKPSLAIGPRVVFGASIVVKDLPVDVYAEIAPTFYLLDLASFSPSWAVDGQIGAHYYF